MAIQEKKVGEPGGSCPRVGQTHGLTSSTGWQELNTLLELGQVMGPIGIPDTASDEPAPGAVQGLLAAAKGDRARDRAGAQVQGALSADGLPTVAQLQAAVEPSMAKAQLRSEPAVLGWPKMVLWAGGG